MNNFTNNDKEKWLNDPGPLRAHLNAALHRHQSAKFGVKIIIHSLNSVPFLGGQFDVRWRCRGIISYKGKDRAAPRPDGMEERRVSLDSLASLTKEPTRSSASSSSSSSLSRQASSSEHTTMSSVGSDNSSNGTDIKYTTSERGSTPVLSLSSHKVVYEHQVNFVVGMHVAPPTATPASSRPTSPTKSKFKFTNSPSVSPLKLPQDLPEKSSPPTQPGTLLSLPIKFSIHQHPEEGQPPPQHPRLGAVYLDLAEYAGSEGTSDPGVRRKYLLRDSKINAILELTIQMTPLAVPIAGYIAPVLRSSTIQSSLTTLRPAPFRNNSSTSVTSNKSGRQGRIPAIAPKDGVESKEDTEALIEALFNPFPVGKINDNSVGVVGPFAYYSSSALPVTESDLRIPLGARKTSSASSTVSTNMSLSSSGVSRRPSKKSTLSNEIHSSPNPSSLSVSPSASRLLSESPPPSGDEDTPHASLFVHPQTKPKPSLDRKTTSSSYASFGSGNTIEEDDTWRGKERWFLGP